MPQTGTPLKTHPRNTKDPSPRSPNTPTPRKRKTQKQNMGAPPPSQSRQSRSEKRAYPDLNQGPADLQSAALTTELYTHVYRAHTPG